MGEQFTPSNWFWIFMAILITCYIKIAAPRVAEKTPVMPASIAHLLW